MYIDSYFITLSHDKMIQLLITVIVLDVLFGILRAIKEHETNSTIGINGIIRKVGMIITILFCVVIDKIIDIDLIFFIPTELKEVLKFDEVGITFLFNSLFIIFEFLSILKNMYKCNLPIPEKLKRLLERLLKEFTSEVEENEKIHN